MRVSKFFALLAVTVTGGFISSNNFTGTAQENEKFKLIWNDEFEGDTVDMTKWSYELGNWKLDEQELYHKRLGK